MTAFINITTLEYPLHVGDLEPAFSGEIENFLIPEGFAIVREVQPPEHGEDQYVAEVAPEEIDGVWVQRFEIREVSEEAKLAAKEFTDQMATPSRGKAPPLSSAGSEPSVID
jgi:hypothetical protein